MTAAREPITAPLPSADCPGPDGPAPEGGLLDRIPVIGDAKHVVDQIGHIADTLLGWVGDPGRMVHDVGGWFTWHLFGWDPDHAYCYQPSSPYGFFRSILMGDVRLEQASVYHDAYQALALGSMALVMLAGMARMVRTAADSKAHWTAGIVDVLPRVLVGLGAIQAGFSVFAWVLPELQSAGWASFRALASLAGAPASGGDPLSLLLYSTIARAPSLGLVGAVLLLVLIFLWLRVLFLLIGRFLIVSFGLALAPLAFAIAVFDHRNRAVQWWASMMAGAAVIPVVSSICLGLTVGLSLRLAQGDQALDSVFSGGLAGTVVAVGGLWFTGRALRALLFEGVAGRHDSAVGFLRSALEAAVMLPVAAAALLGPAAVRSMVPGALGRAMAGAGAHASMGYGTLGVTSAGMDAARRGHAESGTGGGSSPPFSTAAEAYEAFKTDPAGEALAVAATAAHVPAGTPTAARWAHLEALPGMSGPLQRVAEAAFASATRTGRFEVTPRDREMFLTAARGQDPGAPEQQETPPAGPGDEGS